MYLTILWKSGWVEEGSLLFELLMPWEKMLKQFLNFRWKGCGGGRGKCPLHHGDVDFFWNNPLSSYNLGQKCYEKWTLPCLVLR